MTDPKQRRSIPKMLSFKGVSSSSPPRGRLSGPASPKSPLKSRLSPTRLVNKGMKALVNHNHHHHHHHDKKRRSVRPIQNSVASSITCSDFESSQDLSNMLDDKNDLVSPPLTNMRRAVSMDSDSKPLRPYRRGSSARHVQHLKSDYNEPSPLDAGLLACSVNSSITFADFGDLSGLLGVGEESSWLNNDASDALVPPPPNMKRAVSMDSDSKPLRPLRRESQFTSSSRSKTNSMEHQYYDDHDYHYPGPTRTMAKRSGSLDSQPIFPTRRDSTSQMSRVSDSTSSSSSSKNSSSNKSMVMMMDCSPSVPGRKSSMISLEYNNNEVAAEASKGIINGGVMDDQRPPSMPNRKTSIAHNSHTSTEISDELSVVEREASSSSLEQNQQDELPPDTEMMSVTSAVA